MNHCTITNCTNPHYSKQMCRRHYDRMARTGSPFLAVQPTIEQRFLAKVDVADSGCWLWGGALLADGYGQFRAGKRAVRAHRWAYEHWVAPIAEGLQLDHLCINPRCVNPAHLEEVTFEENMRRSRYAVCLRGHHFTAENTYNFNRRKADGTPTVVRTCRQCFIAGRKRRQKAKNGQLAAS